ncbi:MAG TPA: carboxypeptidase regulatory-like domain-containing protein, partial [Candidatus Cloacimonas sp.]|nr:carboxypeptidase regulatory-like domain-containing protein [Candidatus Cloacimonas sp.]
SWDFGQTLIRTTKTKNFTITNIGGGTLSIISIAIEGDYYTLLTNPAPIGLTAGQTAIFTVQYAPLAVGNHNGTVTITDNRGTTIVDLSAVCYDPTIYSLPWIEDFGTTGTTFPPEYWTRWSGLLTAEPVTLTSVTSYWIQDDFANIVTNPANKSAKINIFGTTYKYWFITPPIQIPDTGYQLEFDLALTDYNNPAPPDDPAGYSGVDDKFVVLIGDGNSWSLANAVKIWDNDPTTEGGIYKVYNSISYTGEHCIIPLNSYVGFKYIAFYGESTVSNADNDLFVDNVMIRQTPSGAPDHVTLVSPANGATGLDPENIVLTWSPALTGGTPAYYQVMIGEYPIDPETGYFGDYQFDTENTNMNISAMLLDNLGFVLPYNTTWYWAVVPFNAGGEIPDLEAHEFMIWHFTTNVDPTITALSYAEYFDEVTAPTLPWGWKAYVSSTSTSAYVRTYYGTTYAQSTPNSVCLFNSTDTSADLRLITPPINVPGVSLNQIKLKFYAYGGSGYTLLIGTVNTTDASGVFTQVASINPTATKTEYTVSFENYTGTDHYICFKHGLGGTSRYIYIDNVKIIKLQPADLAATALSGPALIQTGTSYNYTISVYNEGTAEQSSYTVNLKSGTQPLVSLNVNSPLAVGATTQHTLIWTPQTAGIYPVYGEVVIAGDDNINNNATITINVNVADATVTVLSVGNDATTTSGYYLPLNLYFKNSVTEELYFTDEMHLQTGIITAIAYKNNFTDNIANKPVKIWMKCTTEQSLTTAWLSSQNYTLVFDGTINFPAGINYVVIPLDTPFNFTGGVLATRVNRPMDVTYYPSSNVFYYTNTSTEHPNRSLYLYSDSVVYDPLAPSAVGTLVSNVPNTFFVVQNATTDPQAILQGYVRNFVTNQPIVGATVTLTERLSTTTDANGFYKFSFWTNKTVDLTVQKDTYYSQTITNIALTVGTTVTQNFNLVPLPRVTV